MRLEVRARGVDALFRDALLLGPLPSLRIKCRGSFASFEGAMLGRGGRRVDEKTSAAGMRPSEGLREKERTGEALLIPLGRSGDDVVEEVEEDNVGDKVTEEKLIVFLRASGLFCSSASVAVRRKASAAGLVDGLAFGVDAAEVTQGSFSRL